MCDSCEFEDCACQCHPVERKTIHDRDWYQEHDPQSLVDADNEHNRP